MAGYASLTRATTWSEVLVEFGRQIRVAVMREHAADLIRHDAADRQIGGKIFLREENHLGGLPAGLRPPPPHLAQKKQLVDIKKPRRHGALPCAGGHPPPPAP